MTNRPTSIRVCGQLFRIGYEMDWTNHALGFVNLNEGLIELNPELPDDQARETLLHEVIHAVDKLSMSGMVMSSLYRDDKKGDKMFRLEEWAVVGISCGLWMTLADPRNREAVDWMLNR